MSGKIEISRELAERLVNPHSYVSSLARNELRALLAAPVVERQEPVAYRRFDGEGNFDYWDDGDGKGGSIHFPIEPLYTSPPAPVADDMVRLLTRARIYARGEFGDEIDACLLKAKRMNK